MVDHEAGALGVRGRAYVHRVPSRRRGGGSSGGRHPGAGDETRLARHQQRGTKASRDYRKVVRISSHGRHSVPQPYSDPLGHPSRASPSRPSVSAEEGEQPAFRIGPMTTALSTLGGGGSARTH